MVVFIEQVRASIQLQRQNARHVRGRTPIAGLRTLTEKSVPSTSTVLGEFAKDSELFSVPFISARQTAKLCHVSLDLWTSLIISFNLEVR